ncbi:MAG TPA: hypothetical protein VKS21_05635 [Spirochaetota bacterium]|nr:hypothetical protein [Spirochaetota bacterium]
MVRYLTAALLCLSLFAYATDFHYTVSPYFRTRNHGAVFVNYNRMLGRNFFGKTYKSLVSLPVGVKHSFFNNFQVRFTWPVTIAAFYLLNKENRYSSQAGQPILALNFNWDDIEYNSTKGVMLRVMLKFKSPYEDSVLTNKGRSYYKNNFTAEAPGIEDGTDFYPAVKARFNYDIGYMYAKKISQKSTIQFNFRYNYSFTTAEENGIMTNIFPVGGWTRKKIITSRDTAGNETQVTNKSFILFGFIPMFKNWFWRQNGSDPWYDKKNDYLLFTGSIDTFINTDYYINNKKIIIAFKPYIEFAFFKRFSKESLEKTRLVISPGVWLKVTKWFRFVAGLHKTIYAEKGYNYKQSFFLSLRVAY